MLMRWICLLLHKNQILTEYLTEYFQIPTWNSVNIFLIVKLKIFILKTKRSNIVQSKHVHLKLLC